MATTLPVNFEVPLVVAPVDDLGNPAVVENIVWSLNSTAATVFPSADGMSAFVVPGDVAGETVQLTVDADARIGAGERHLTSIEEFVLVAAEAVNMSLGIGALQPKTSH